MRLPDGRRISEKDPGYPFLAAPFQAPGIIRLAPCSTAPLAALSWFSVWGLYAAYTWTTAPDLSTSSSVRFYLPAIGAIALLGAWPVTRLPLRAPLAAITATAAVAAMFGLGIWSYNSMRTCPFTAVCAGQLSPASAGRTGLLESMQAARPQCDKNPDSGFRWSDGTGCATAPGRPPRCACSL